MPTKVLEVNLPVSYSVASFDNERFLKLRVKIMHSGLNLNNSNFNTESIEAAAPTLANIPLLAFVKKVDGEDSNGDFAGHEYEIKITEDDVKYVYLGRPIGIIPETNNYATEIDEESGKMFVVADAYVWKDYANSALDILNRDKVKKVSMEILVDDYEWHDSYVDIKAYKYTGVALLGEDVKEAMIGAKAEVVKYSANSISSMMADLKEELAKFTNEEINNNEDEATAGESQFNEDGVQQEEQTQEEDSDFSETETDEANKKELDLDNEFNETGIESEGEKAETSVNSEDYQAQIEDLKKQVSQLAAENEDLKAFKVKIEQEKVEANKEILFKEFDDLEEEEIQTLRDSDYSLEELEIRLFALRGKKVSTQKSSAKVVVTNPAIKSSIKKEPEYADIIRKYKQN